MSKDAKLDSIISEMIQKKFTMFPIEHHDIWETTMSQIASFWFVNEIDLKDDVKQWEKTLSHDDKEFIKTILAFFAASDGIVSENIVKNFVECFSDVPEVVYMYSFQNFMENVHSHTYSLLIDTLIKNEQEKHDMFQSIKNHPAIRQKAEWALRWIHDDECNPLELLVAMACVEGIFFSSSFLGIFWLKKRGLMPGLCYSNELISRDEGMHERSACLLHHKLANGSLKPKRFCPDGKPLPPLSSNRIKEIVVDSVNVECDFVDSALKKNLVGMNAELMKQHVQVCADVLLKLLDVEPVYNVKSPFEWMQLITLGGKTSFFERRVSEYQRGTNAVKSEEVFVDDADYQ